MQGRVQQMGSHRAQSGSVVLFVRLAMKLWLENQTNIIVWSIWMFSKLLSLKLPLFLRRDWRGLRNTAELDNVQNIEMQHGDVLFTWVEIPQFIFISVSMFYYISQNAFQGKKCVLCAAHVW